MIAATTVAHGYIRCSHQDSADSGLGLEAQRRQIEAAFAKIVPAPLELRLYSDLVKSAYKYHFKSRPQAAALDDALQPGDRIIVAKIDRAFRNLLDQLRCIVDWHKRGITIHLLDADYDLTTPTGWLMMQTMGAFTEHDSAQKSRRIREALDVKRKAGLPVGGRPPPGKKWDGPKGRRTLIDDLPMRAVMQEIVRLKDAGRTWRETTLALEERLAGLQGRKPTPYASLPYNGERLVRDWYFAEMKLRAEEKE